MDASLRLRSVQHDSLEMIRRIQHERVCGISSKSEESSAWMLHSAYAPFSMTVWK